VVCCVGTTLSPESVVVRAPSPSCRYQNTKSCLAIVQARLIEMIDLCAHHSCGSTRPRSVNGRMHHMPIHA
jgi:hypothetical protein